MREVDELAGVAQEDVRQDLQAMFRGAIRASLEVFSEQELEELVGAEWYARVGGRRDRRNGSYRRRLSRTRRWIKQRDERAEKLAQILLHITRNLT